jgi:hypothetical protein
MTTEPEPQVIPEPAPEPEPEDGELGDEGAGPDPSGEE